MRHGAEHSHTVMISIVDACLTELRVWLVETWLSLILRQNHIEMEHTEARQNAQEEEEEPAKPTTAAKASNHVETKSLAQNTALPQAFLLKVREFQMKAGCVFAGGGKRRRDSESGGQRQGQWRCP